MSKKQERQSIWYPGETPVKINNKIFDINISLSKSNKDMKYGLISKELGGVLLDQKILQNASTSIIQNNIREKSTELLHSILYKDTVINDPYVLGKYYSNLLSEKEIIQYYKQNNGNIINYLLSSFPKLKEEEDCLEKLREIYGNTVKKVLGSKYTQNLSVLYNDVLQGKNLTNKELLHKNIKDIYGQDLLKELIEAYNKDIANRVNIIDNNISKVRYFFDNVSKDENEALLGMISNDLLSKVNIFSSDDSAKKFLADIKIIKKTIRALTKINISNSIEDHIDINYQISTALENNNKFFPIAKVISGHTKIYKTGSISEETYGITGDIKSYQILWSKLQDLSDKIDLASGFKNAMQGKAQNTLGWDKLITKEQDHLYELTYFILGLETIRNSGNIISAPMFFDLVKSGIYKISDIADKLPMSMKGAVPCSLKVDEMLGMTYGSDTGLLSTHHYYDYRTKINGATKELMQDFLHRDKQLFIDWIVHQKMQIDNKLKLNDTKLAKVYFENIGYNTNIENDDLVILKNNYAIKIIFDKGSYSYELLSFPAKAIAELINDWYGIDNVEHFPKDNINLVSCESLEKYFNKNISIELFSDEEDQVTSTEDTILGKRKKKDDNECNSVKKRKLNDLPEKKAEIEFSDNSDDSSEEEQETKFGNNLKNSLDLYTNSSDSDSEDIYQNQDILMGDVDTDISVDW